MLAIFRSLSVYFLKNVCFIILNFLYFNFKRCWLFAVFGPAHAWVGMRIHGGTCGRSEVDFECPPQLLLQLIFFFLSHTMYFSWTSDLPFSLYWLASEPPNSAFLYSPPHYWGYRCTQSHLAFMWMFVRSSWLCGKPLTHQAASLASEFPYIGCFQILSLCAKKTCLEGQDWLCTSLALVPCFPSIKFVQ